MLSLDVENLRGPKLKDGIQGKTVTKRQEATLEAKFIADPVPDATWCANFTKFIFLFVSVFIK